MTEDIGAWFASRLPGTWFTAPPEVTADTEEILVIGDLPDVELAAGTAPEARAAARVARIDRFREETREERVKVARRVRDNLRYLKRTGHLLGVVPQGYRRVDGAIVEDPEVAPVIRRQSLP